MFGAAIGIPTFFVPSRSSNRFLLEVVRQAKGVRSSRRYPGYLRIYHREFRPALLRVLEREARGLVEAMGMQDTIRDLRDRIEHPELVGTAGGLTRGVLRIASGNDSMCLGAREFRWAWMHCP